MINVCVVGVGLIGGSLGLSLRRVRTKGRRVYHVVGLGRNRSKLLKAKRAGLVDDISIHAAEALPSSDIVVLCLPVQSMAKFVGVGIALLKSGAIVTDVGSVKEKIQVELETITKKRPDVSFVGAHPLAGSEKTGFLNARAGLFDKAVCVLTNGKESRAARLRVEKMWKDVGARVLPVSVRQHDEALALTSHLPHLVAFALVRAMAEKATSIPALGKLTAGSFADATRVAASDAELWQGIFSMNKTALKNAMRTLARHMKILSSMTDASLETELARIAKIKEQRYS